MNSTELTTGAPACTYPTAVGDSGFGAVPVVVVDRATFCAPGAPLPVGPVEFRGNLAFNVQSIIESASTGPFFHDNSKATLETVIDHYGSGLFHTSPTGAGNGFIISTVVRGQIAAFLRALNVLDAITNARASIALGTRTAKLNEVEPLAWLTDVLERMVSARTKAYELEHLLAWIWKAERLVAAVDA